METRTKRKREQEQTEEDNVGFDSGSGSGGATKTTTTTSTNKKQKKVSYNYRKANDEEEEKDDKVLLRRCCQSVTNNNEEEKEEAVAEEEEETKMTNETKEKEEEEEEAEEENDNIPLSFQILQLYLPKVICFLVLKLLASPSLFEGKMLWNDLSFGHYLVAFMGNTKYITQQRDVNDNRLDIVLRDIWNPGNRQSTTTTTTTTNPFNDGDDDADGTNNDDDTMKDEDDEEEEKEKENKTTEFCSLSHLQVITPPFQNSAYYFYQINRYLLLIVGGASGSEVWNVETLEKYETIVTFSSNKQDSNNIRLTRKYNSHYHKEDILWQANQLVFFPHLEKVLIVQPHENNILFCRFQVDDAKRIFYLNKFSECRYSRNTSSSYSFSSSSSSKRKREEGGGKGGKQKKKNNNFQAASSSSFTTTNKKKTTRSVVAAEKEEEESKKGDERFVFPPPSPSFVSIWSRDSWETFDFEFTQIADNLVVDVQFGFLFDVAKEMFLFDLNTILASSVAPGVLMSSNKSMVYTNNRLFVLFDVGFGVVNLSPSSSSYNTPEIEFKTLLKRRIGSGVLYENTRRSNSVMLAYVESKHLFIREFCLGREKGEELKEAPAPQQDQKPKKNKKKKTKKQKQEEESRLHWEKHFVLVQKIKLPQEKYTVPYKLTYLPSTNQLVCVSYFKLWIYDISTATLHQPPFDENKSWYYQTHRNLKVIEREFDGKPCILANSIQETAAFV